MSFVASMLGCIHNLQSPSVDLESPLHYPLIAHPSPVPSQLIQSLNLHHADLEIVQPVALLIISGTHAIFNLLRRTESAVATLSWAPGLRTKKA